ncbi:MAG: hypothetical protein AB1806_00850 [Acidobacteriota bacterium]
MKLAPTSGSLAALVLLCAVSTQAQTADEVVEKHLAALGGRAALEKVTSQVATGAITVSTQMGNISGTVEVSRKAPNKTRSLTVLDLSAMGGTDMVIDQRCDGTAAWVSNSLQGDRDITGDQLQGLLNAYFPSPLMNYRETGGRIELTGKDTFGGRPVHALQYTPKAGPVTKFLIDAETFHIVRSVATINIPEAGGPLEQTSEPGDYRAVDGIQVPFAVTVVNPMQTVSIALSKVEINKALDDAVFAKPAVK